MCWQDKPLFSRAREKEAWQQQKRWRLLVTQNLHMTEKCFSPNIDHLQLVFLIPDTSVSSIYSYARSTKQAHTKISWALCVNSYRQNPPQLPYPTVLQVERVLPERTLSQSPPPWKILPLPRDMNHSKQYIYEEKFTGLRGFLKTDIASAFQFWPGAVDDLTHCSNLMKFHTLLLGLNLLYSA